MRACFGNFGHQACFGDFGHHGPGPQRIDPFYWLKVLLKTRSKSASIEPLVDLLAYL